MAKYFRYFETEAEFESAYTGEEYVEPFVAYVEENEEVAFDKATLSEIKLRGVRTLADVPASGGTVTEADCDYTVLAIYDDFSRVDVTEDAVVSGSLTVSGSMIEERHSAGTLTLTAEYSGLSATSMITVYQEAFVPSVTGITFEDLEWVENVPKSGGTATPANCTFKVYAEYDNGTTKDVTAQATVTGSLEVPASTESKTHSAGTLVLTASYDEFTVSDNVVVYQDGYDSEFLTFNILSNGKIIWAKFNSSAPAIENIEYNVNDNGWTEIDSDYYEINVSEGDVVKFKGCNESYGSNKGSYYGFQDSTAGFALAGNIMSLIAGENFVSATTLTSNSTFYRLFFGCSGLTSAKNLILPATTLTDYCYYGMFGYCGSLTLAPSVLPASTLTEECYSTMFENCSSLTTAPELPATTLANACYRQMFSNCTSLTTAPALPATTLAQSCYSSMFWNCTSLTTAPELPAETLVNSCYYYLFYGCTSLTYIKCLATDISASNCTARWVTNVETEPGTFVKNPNMSSWQRGVGGIPYGWTIQDAS